MPTIGHAIIGLTGSRLHEGRRPRLRSALVFTALATFPDLDLLFPEPAVPLSAWAHRGALHSLLAAVLAAAIGAWLLRGSPGRAWTFLLALGTAASHGLLDAFADGGESVMLLWPFDLRRFQAPWPLIPPSPFGAPVLSLGFLARLLCEGLLFSPLLLFALWPSRRAERSGPERSAREGWPRAPAADRDYQ